MDTLTHALGGALAARVSSTGGELTLRGRMLAGWAAAAFPDIDYALFWIAPLDFLNWHRGPTHSLVLLPVWALVLSGLFSRLTGGRRSWRLFYGVCALGLAVHIGGDLITIYGTKLLWPLSDEPLGLGIVFDVDPYVAVIIGLGFAASLVVRFKGAMAVMVVALAAYLALQGALYWRTISIGKDYLTERGLNEGWVYALPQPLAPVFWKVVIAHRNHYFVAYVNHLAQDATAPPENAGFLMRMVAGYRPVHDLRWIEESRLGSADPARTIARRAWNRDGFAAFRRFAVLPALYRIDWGGEGEVCVWFTDLRHNFPVLPPSFRYGMCQIGSEGEWRLYRLRYFSEAGRQRLQ